MERGVRQILDDKISGTLVGIWLLIPEYLRLGTWDLLTGWAKTSPNQIEPRLALQMVNESALCVTGIRQGRCLSQQGFEVANGLPFVASDQAVHHLLEAHTVGEAEALQIALGKIRRASGHFAGNTLAIDPHRMRSYSKRQMRRHRGTSNPVPWKMAQTFFCLDVDTGQPVALTTATSGRTVTEAGPRLLDMAEQIIAPRHRSPLVLADTEHFSAPLFEYVHEQTPFQLLAPMSKHKCFYQKMLALDPSLFTPRWAGFATATVPYQFVHSNRTFHQIIQRCGEASENYSFKGFVSTQPGNEVELLTLQYPERWHVEEFFNANQALGWKRAGTHNLHIRYAQMTFALLAQAALYQVRQRLHEPYAHWDAAHLAQKLLAGLDGDIRVSEDTIIVTFYNAPNADKLSRHYSRLPAKLSAEGIDPHIPWLYGFKLDFRFK